MSSPKPLPPSELAEHLAEVFTVVGPLYRHAARLVAAGEAIEGVSTGVRAVLEQLDRAGPQPVPRLADALAVSRQFAQRMVDDALAASFVMTTPNPRHRRSSLVQLTRVGQRTITAITTRERQVLATVAGDLTEDDLAACLRVLRAALTTLASTE